MTCASCGATLPGGAKFCVECGTAVAVHCATCGTVSTGGRFCAECGSPLGTSGPPPEAEPLTDAPSPVAERRLTSVLFADLVGFTTLAEGRDAEEVRDLLSRYFSGAREVVERYGGTVEKFIGDAVMAVWGVPVAHEDDAERAVRTGLDLVSLVAELGDEVGTDQLRVRAGIVTGEVAVTLGATGEGMVAGDVVNTAARVQTAATPGQVWVDEATRSLSAAAVAYADAGTHALKGKAEPVRLFHAERVVAARGGIGRVDGLDAGFVGRDRELRLVKEVFHAVGETRQARLVAVTGAAGIGKSRLAWEFEKYVDGITASVLWHRGRALAYGDGVALWALTEMVRSRLGVTDGDPPAVVGGKLDGTLAELFTDTEERAWVRARLAALLAVPGADTDVPRLDLFTAWRVFFEAVATDDRTVAMVIEDAQYADDGLLDFLEFLVDTAAFPLFVMTLARPELTERRPQWGTGRRALSVYLEPMRAEDMGRLLDDLVAGLPEPVKDALTTSSEGLPLYALETVRGLVDRDVVVPREGRYVLAEGSEALVDLAAADAPTSLRALIASRLDALPAAERRCLQDAAVLGQSFTPEGITALHGAPDVEVPELLDSLARRQLLSVDTDPRSPERGSFRFVSPLVRTVAYETLARRDRKQRHLAAAAYLSDVLGTDGEMAAVVAAHLLAARDSAPSDPDATAVAARACALLEQAGGRAAGLGAPAEAVRHYESALGLAGDDESRARLSLAVARASLVRASYAHAAERAETARDVYLRAGQPVAAALSLAWAATAWGSLGDWRRVITEVTPVLDELGETAGSEEAVMQLCAVLARAHFMVGEPEDGARISLRRLRLAEAVQDWEQLADALNRYSTVLATQGSPVTSHALTVAALELARRERVVGGDVIPLNNLAAFAVWRDLAEAERYAREGLARAVSLGDHDTGSFLLANLLSCLWLSGAWDELLRCRRDYPLGGDVQTGTDLATELVLLQVALARGEVSGRVEPEDQAATDDLYTVGYRHLRSAFLAEADGRTADWAHHADRALDALHRTSGLDDEFCVAWPHGVAAALANGDLSTARRHYALVAEAPPGHVVPYLRAQALRFRALLAEDGEASVDADFEAAASRMSAFGAPFWTGRILLEHGEWLQGQGRAADAEARLARAEELFAGLGAAPWVARVTRLRAPGPPSLVPQPH